MLRKLNVSNLVSDLEMNKRKGDRAKKRPEQNFTPLNRPRLRSIYRISGLLACEGERVSCVRPE